MIFFVSEIDTPVVCFVFFRAVESKNSIKNINLINYQQFIDIYNARKSIEKCKRGFRYQHNGGNQRFEKTAGGTSVILMFCKWELVNNRIGFLEWRTLFELVWVAGLPLARPDHEFLVFAVLSTWGEYETKYSRMEQVKFVEDNL